MSRLLNLWGGLWIKCPSCPINQHMYIRDVCTPNTHPAEHFMVEIGLTCNNCGNTYTLEMTTRGEIDSETTSIKWRTVNNKPDAK